MLFELKTGGVRWVAVFLGNPGAKYTKTRHNAGFMTADIIEKQEKIRINRLRFSALTAIAVIGGEKTLLVKPQTYMNLSGKSVSAAATYYKLAPERVIVVCDDVSLPLGKIRIRKSGSAGGHNGLKSIIADLGSEGFPRIKIGVGAPEGDAENAMADWVLGDFSGKEEQIISESCSRAAQALKTYINEGAERAMSLFN